MSSLYEGIFPGGASVQYVRIDALRPGDSPRLAGESVEHARALADSEATLPPIVVQRSTMRVIDGMHRLQAAVLRGQRDILVQFYDGDDDDAFVLAVQANVSHGLPLSRVDRKAATARILAAHPDWSDRKVASITGLAATTVGAIRQRSTERSGQLEKSGRVGRDGKLRPLDATEGRLLASKLIQCRPEAPIREIAEAAGVSPATALDVRRRLREGQPPVPDRQRARVATKNRQQGDQLTNGDGRASQAANPAWDLVLDELKKDPSLRFTDAGRALLRWLDVHTVGLSQWKQQIDNSPAHSVQAIAELARRNSVVWQEVARYLQQRTT